MKLKKIDLDVLRYSWVFQVADCETEHKIEPKQPAVCLLVLFEPVRFGFGWLVGWLVGRFAQFANNL